MIKFFCTIILIITTSCGPHWYKPNGYLLFRQMPKNGTPGFNLGWNHGCESGLGTTYGMAIGMTFYTWKKDPDISSSNPDIPKIKERYNKELKDVNWNDLSEVKKNLSDYNTIFWSAYNFCKHSALKSMQMGGINPPLPGEPRYDPMKHSIGNIWKIDGRGDTRIGSPDGGNSLW